MIQLTSQKSNLYMTFCFILTVVYFASIIYNISIAEADGDLIEDEIEMSGPKSPAAAEAVVVKKHLRDVSMTEYVQYKLRGLSRKPWNEVLKTPLVRNYLLLLTLLLILFIGLFTYAVYKQYQHVPQQVL